MIKRESNTAYPSDNTFTAIGIGLVILAMVLVVQYAGQQLWHPPAPFAFPVPADVCVVQWQPRILMQNTATRTQTYLRRDGARVTVLYDYDTFTGAVTERGRETWFNGECSERAVKGRG